MIQWNLFFLYGLVLMLNEREDSKALFDTTFMGRDGLEQKL